MSVIEKLIIEHPILSAYIIASFFPDSGKKKSDREYVVNGLINWALVAYILSLAHR